MEIRNVNINFRPIGLALVSAILGACSSVYHFNFQPDSDLDKTTVEGRLLDVLTPNGFRAREKAPSEETRAIGATGYFRCETAEEVRVLEKEWRSLGQYHWVWVHSFKCNGAPKFVVSSSPNADSEAKRIQESLASEFRKEVESGVLLIGNKPRLPLE